MKIRFAKYQGTGNDFIIINNISNSFPKDNNDLIGMLCDRKFGIGADGLILIEKNHKLDFEMKYFNSDGHIGSMCGNGARCSIHYSFVNKLIKSVTHFYACDGKHRGEINNNIVKVSINDVSKHKYYDDFIFVNTGSPHLVKVVDDVNAVDLIKQSRIIQKKNIFKDGVNINYLHKLKNNKYMIRTYERGVENETLSCGTGAVASAIVLNILSLLNTEKVILQTKGGDLTVNFKNTNETFSKIYLSGEVVKVFDGKLEI